MKITNKTVLTKPAQAWIWSLCTKLLLDCKIQAVDNSSILTGGELDLPADVFLCLVSQSYIKSYMFK